MTQSVATLWYRSPEIVLLAHDYSSPADIFGLGCVAAEMFRLKPLFPSRNDADMLWRLLKMLGNPIASGWKQGQTLLEKRGSYLEIDPNDFSNEDFRRNLTEWLGSGAVKRNPGPLLHLLIGMMSMNPSSRLTASQALQNPYFHQSPSQKAWKSPSAIPTGHHDLDIASCSVVTTSPHVEEGSGHTSPLGCDHSINNSSRQYPQKLVLKRCK
jgi:serine/threonine protein kinase